MKFDEKYAYHLSLINKKLEELKAVPSYEETVTADAMNYSVSNGGKRIRPVLALECCLLSGGKIEEVIDCACALEFIHTYSLIHDDLPCMDDDDIRRGKPSCHKAFGEAFALLAGDALLTDAFSVVSSSTLDAEKKVKIISSLSANAGYNGMIGGQVIDLSSEGKKITYDKLKTLHSLKTGCLIRCAAEIGCICAGAGQELTEKLISYADYLGLAFQIVDDILDVTGDQSLLGKPIGSDEQNEKTTYVSLFGLEEAEKMAKEITEKAKCSVKDIPGSDFLIELADNLSVRKK